jgi:hypothetical protein
MESGNAAEDRRTGGAMAVVGTLIISLGVLVVLYDLPILGGEVYGSRTQNLSLLFMSGTMLLLAGLLGRRGGGGPGTETLSTPGPIDGDDGPSGAG